MAVTADRFRAYNKDGFTIQDGDVPATQKVKIKNSEQVAKVVFYAGPQEEEAVVGCTAEDHFTGLTGTTEVDFQEVVEE